MATVDAPPETEKKERAPRTEADYGIEEMDFLPSAGKPGRSSKLKELLETVQNDHPGKWLVVAKYEKTGAAAAAASTLRSKYGPAEANGWEFATRQIEGGAKTALFVKFDGSLIKPGAASAFENVRAEKEQKRLEKQAKKDEDKAKAERKADRAAANAAR